MPFRLRYVPTIYWSASGQGRVHSPADRIDGIWRQIVSIRRRARIEVVQQILLTDVDFGLRRVELPVSNPMLVGRHRRVGGRKRVGDRVMKCIDNIDLVSYTCRTKGHHFIGSQWAYLQYVLVNALKLNGMFRPHTQNRRAVRLVNRGGDIQRDCGVPGPVTTQLGAILRDLAERRSQGAERHKYPYHREISHV